jgi:hypothetical protein
MRYIVLALALCFAFSPAEAASNKVPHKVKPRKNKVKGHKAPKRQKVRHNMAA